MSFIVTFMYKKAKLGQEHNNTSRLVHLLLHVALHVWRHNEWITLDHCQWCMPDISQELGHYFVFDRHEPFH